MGKPNFILLANESSVNYEMWTRALRDYEHRLSYSTVDITSNNWLKEITTLKPDCLLACPEILSVGIKNLYDERLFILNQVLKYPIHPSYKEVMIYENKRLLASWLQSVGINSPATSIFYHKEEAEHYIRSASFPIVAKVNLSTSGGGVVFLHDKKQAYNYLNRAFEGKGISKRWGPNFAQVGLLKRCLQYLFNYRGLKNRINVYRIKKSEVQKGFVIFQEYITHTYEWRVVRIGDSFFAHKKIKIKEKASGTKKKEYCNPPLDLLTFVKGLTDQHGLYSEAIDIFEVENRGYLVNEIHCFFGQSDPYQMLVDGKPGRYRFENGAWVFEEGDFNKNGSFNLRVEYLLKLFE